MATSKTMSDAADASLDAAALLKADHRTVEALFEKYESAKNAAAKAKIAQSICLELSIHAAIEEEIFYPAVEGKIEGHLVDEAHVEHDGAKMLIAEILAGGPEDAFYDAKVKVLSEEIKHHVKEEEQRGGMFAQAKAAGIDMLALGERLAARKKELKAAFERDGIPVPTTRSMKGVKLKVSQPVK